MKILSIFGTRPEAIKMAPLVKRLALERGVTSLICVTGQHRTMLQQVMDVFDITADYDLDIMAPNQTLNSIGSRIFTALDPILEQVNPDRVLVHGDTTTATISGLAAFHRRIPVAHVEAGLRTGDLSQPWPEEMNRRVLDVISDVLLVPTVGARNHLKLENLHGRVVVTGNTVIDALEMTTRRLNEDPQLAASVDARLPTLDPDRKLLLVTGHRRENFGEGFLGICNALAALARRSDMEIVYPVHLNPNVQEPVNRILSGLKNVHLIDPLDYLSFVRLMQRAYVILTDSGGVQEEAPSLGKPVLVMRDVTERPEAVAAGTVQLVGTNAERIIAAVARLYDRRADYLRASQTNNPYGDGLACERIVDTLMGREISEFNPYSEREFLVRAA
jgi:UDP-N-acetylglucosamine 2-epimerase (non-hydrolysing)